MAFANLSKINIGDIMSRQVATISEEYSVMDAAVKMNSMNIGAIIVLNSEKKLVGIYSERDNLRQTAEGKNPSNIQLLDVMTKNPVSLKSDTPLSEAFKIMQNGNFRHLPIIDDEKLVGIVSMKDINKCLYANFLDILFGEK